MSGNDDGEMDAEALAKAEKERKLFEAMLSVAASGTGMAPPNLTSYPYPTSPKASTSTTSSPLSPSSSSSNSSPAVFCASEPSPRSSSPAPTSTSAAAAISAETSPSPSPSPSASPSFSSSANPPSPNLSSSPPSPSSSPSSSGPSVEPQTPTTPSEPEVTKGQWGAPLKTERSPSIGWIASSRSRGERKEPITSRLGDHSPQDDDTKLTVKTNFNTTDDLPEWDSTTKEEGGELSKSHGSTTERGRGGGASPKSHSSGARNEEQLMRGASTGMVKRRQDPDEKRLIIAREVEKWGFVEKTNSSPASPSSLLANSNSYSSPLLDTGKDKEKEKEKKGMKRPNLMTSKSKRHGTQPNIHTYLSSTSSRETTTSTPSSSPNPTPPSTPTFDPSPRPTKEKMIQDEIAKWAGGGEGGGGGGGVKSPKPLSASQAVFADPKQAAIEEQVALWASPSEGGKKGGEGGKGGKGGKEGGKEGEGNGGKGGKKGGEQIATYRNRGVGVGGYEIAVWKTNAKARGLRVVKCRVVVKTVKEGEILLSRTLSLGKQDVVAKNSFAVSAGEDPAVVEVIVSFPRSLESCPVSVTLQQELKGEAVDHPMVLEEVVEEGQRGLSRLEYVQPEERGELSREEVSIWRSLSISVGGGRDLPSYLSDLYILIYVGNQQDRTNTLWNFKGNPTWKSLFEFQISPKTSPDQLVIIATLFDAQRDAPIGQAKIQFYNLLSQELLSDWFALEPVEPDQVSGKLHLQLILNQEGSLYIKIQDATNLMEVERKNDSEFEGGMKVHAVVQVEKMSRKSKVVAGTCSPSFDEEFVFKIDLSEKEKEEEGEGGEGGKGEGKVVLVSLWNEGETFIGQLRIPLAGIPKGKVYDHATSLAPRLELKGRERGKKGKLGKLKLDLQFTQTTILGFDFYAPLLKLLTDEDGMLLSVLSKMIPSTEREKLAKTIAKIFHATGTALPALIRLAKHDILSCDEARVLFRGNTLTTKLIDSYQKLVAGDYLKSVLVPTIERVYSLKRALELDPAKEKGEVVGKNKVLMDKELESLFQAIFDSAARCPPEMKYLYGSLDETIVEKFAPKDEDITRHAVVNSFMFLRLIVPGILTPMQFQLISSFPPEHTSRSLTMIGKTVQNLANFTFFGEKESFMSPYNDWITNNLENMRSFYKNVAVVPEGWKEEPRKEVEEGSLEKELSLLHEWIRSLHLDLRSSKHVNDKQFRKIMSACHVVLRSDQNDNEDEGEKLEGEKRSGKGGEGLSSSTGSSTTTSSTSSTAYSSQYPFPLSRSPSTNSRCPPSPVHLPRVLGASGSFSPSTLPPPSLKEGKKEKKEKEDKETENKKEKGEKEEEREEIEQEEREEKEQDDKKEQEDQEKEEEEQRVKEMCKEVEGRAGEIMEGLDGMGRAVGGWEFEEAVRLRDRAIELKGILEGDLERLKGEKGEEEGEGVLGKTISLVEDAIGIFERAKPKEYNH